MTRSPRQISVDGRWLLVDDTGSGGYPILWHAGSPHSGALHEPLIELAAARGIRLVQVSRPGYGGAPATPERRIADAAADAVRVADALGLDRFATVGYSGGGPHSLAVAALAPDRVLAVATFASPAPFVDSREWWGGMRDDSGLRAATHGRAARLALEETFDSEIFTAADWAALAADWGPLGADAAAAGSAGGDGLVDDDVALVRPWGVELGDIRCPVLLVHGRDDRVIPPEHASMLHCALPKAELRWREDAGHVAVLEAMPDALDWLVAAD